MKSTTRIIIVCLFSMSLMNYFTQTYSIKIMRQIDFNNTISNETMISPIIDDKVKIGTEGNFQKVDYVKEISPAGKKAIDTAESGE